MTTKKTGWMVEVGQNWTYDANPEETPRDHVRELVGDTNADKPLVTDDTIELAIATKSDHFAAAAAVCRKIAAHYARDTSHSVAGHSDARDSLMRKYLDLAKAYEERSETESGREVISAPQAVMTSENSIEAYEQDTDLPKPAFSLGMLIDPKFDPRRN